MGEFEFSQTAQQWVNVVLIWIGFGTLAGLLAKTVLPGRDPIGTVGTMVIGIAGSTLGLFVLTRFTQPAHPEGPLNPISPIGMLAATAGAFTLLLAYRLLIAMVVPPQPKEKEKSNKD
ncbi:MAG: GlsB/YeaQ/YmgE family stress response membrane protein [Pirellulales bacterium]|nr:GlsB/YeaQ/YmgE family stress response membrane protein [Pirellulales bacterium]